jgi:pseudaminic acid biosynthesis-associated methylase
MTETTKQLETWQSEFGTAYTDRNVVDWKRRLPAFEKMLAGIELKRVLEIGCNRGHNLQTLLEVLGDGTEIIGVEPNAYALALARSASNKVSAIPGNALDIPFKDGYFDLVFTAGVLIHIPPERLSDAMREIARVTRRYVLAIEYYDEQDTVIEYRGHNDLLWKRDFLKHYQTNAPGLTLVRSGYWAQEDGFDRSHWWLMEKAV